MDDLKAAVELAREGFNHCECPDNWPDCNAARTISDAYLSEHRADDGEPVTEEWCDSVMDRYRDDWGVPYWSPWSQVVFRLDGCVFICNEEFKPAITRGDVRQLCKALGIELKEQA